MDLDIQLKTLFYDLCVSVLSKILAHTLFYWLCVQVLCSVLSPVPPPFLLSSRQLKVAVVSGLPRSPAPNFDNDVLG